MSNLDPSPIRAAAPHLQSSSCVIWYSSTDTILDKFSVNCRYMDQLKVQVHLSLTVSGLLDFFLFLKHITFRYSSSAVDRFLKTVTYSFVLHFSSFLKCKDTLHTIPRYLKF